MLSSTNSHRIAESPKMPHYQQFNLFLVVAKHEKSLSKERLAI